MGDVANLNKFRKQKARAAKKAQAAFNRVKHGRTKAEKMAEESQTVRDEKNLDSAKRE